VFHIVLILFLQLDEAENNIALEIQRLDSAENAACQVVEKAFEEAVRLLDIRRKSYVAQIKETAAAKQEKLREQIELIEKEKVKVRESCDGLEYQVEVLQSFPNIKFTTTSEFENVCYGKTNRKLFK